MAVQAMSADVRQSIIQAIWSARCSLLHFGVLATLWQRDHEPRYALAWKFDLSAESDWEDLDPDNYQAWVLYQLHESGCVITDIATVRNRPIDQAVVSPKPPRASLRKPILPQQPDRRAKRSTTHCIARLLR
jgi:hypothetical protein